MNNASSAHVKSGFAGAAGHMQETEPASRRVPERAGVHGTAEQRVRRGKRLVVGGFVVAVAGVVGYCVACLSAGIGQDPGAHFVESPRPFVGLALGIIGLGTFLWLVGLIIYLNGAMDSNPDGPDLDF